MRVLVSLLAGLLVASVNAAPTSRLVAEDRSPTEDTSPALAEDTVKKDTVAGATQEDTSEEEEDVEDNGNSVKETDRTGFGLFPAFSDVGPDLFASDQVKSFSRDVDRRIKGNFLRLVRELLLMRRLQASPPNIFLRTPQNNTFFGFADVESSTNDSKHDLEHDRGVDDFLVVVPMSEDHDRDGGNLLSFFSGFGSEMPAFLDFPEIPMFSNSNSTYEVEVLNGTRVEVNRTIGRESGDGFNSFFEYELIRLRPEKQPKDQVAAGEDLDVTTPPPQLEEEEKSDGNERQPQHKSKEEQHGPSEELPSVPESENEVV